MPRACWRGRSGRKGDAIVLLGEELRRARRQRIPEDGARAGQGAPPALDLHRERALITLLDARRGRGLLHSAHDCSDGGLAVTLAECASTQAGLAAASIVPDSAHRGSMRRCSGNRRREWWCRRSRRTRRRCFSSRRSSGVPAQIIGTTGGSRITITVAGGAAIDCSITDADDVWSSALERYFAGRAA